MPRSAPRPQEQPRAEIRLGRVIAEQRRNAARQATTVNVAAARAGRARAVAEDRHSHLNTKPCERPQLAHLNRKITAPPIVCLQGCQASWASHIRWNSF